MTLLSQEADAGEPTAIGLYQQLSSYKFVALLHLIGDILDAPNHMSRLCQFRDVCFSAVRSDVRIYYKISSYEIYYMQHNVIVKAGIVFIL
jgi:hypothetical protein